MRVHLCDINDMRWWRRWCWCVWYRMSLCVRFGLCVYECAHTERHGGGYRFINVCLSVFVCVWVYVFLYVRYAPTPFRYLYSVRIDEGRKEGRQANPLQLLWQTRCKRGWFGLDRGGIRCASLKNSTWTFWEMHYAEAEFCECIVVRLCVGYYKTHDLSTYLCCSRCVTKVCNTTLTTEIFIFEIALTKYFPEISR